MTPLKEQQQRWRELTARQKAEKAALVNKYNSDLTELNERHDRERQEEHRHQGETFAAAKAARPGKLDKLVQRARRDWKVDAETAEAALEQLKERQAGHLEHSRPGKFEAEKQLRWYRQVSVLIEEIEQELNPKGE